QLPPATHQVSLNVPAEVAAHCPMKSTAHRAQTHPPNRRQEPGRCIRSQPRFPDRDRTTFAEVGAAGEGTFRDAALPNEWEGPAEAPQALEDLEDQQASHTARMVVMDRSQNSDNQLLAAEGR